MTNRMKRALAGLLTAAALLVCAVPVSARSYREVPYETYTYWEGVQENERNAAYSRPVYEVAQVLDAAGLRTAEFKELKDICTDRSGNVYLLDASSRILVLDGQYAPVRELGAIRDGSESLTYEDANSVYVHTDGTLFICDTEHARVLHCTAEGELIRTYLLPDSPIIPEDYEFRPLHAVMDARGYTYILSDGSYYGMLLYDAEGGFMGFYGANEVTSGIAGTIRNIWNRLFVSDEKKSNTARTLPYVFVDVAVGSDGLLYTATGFTAKNENRGQVKKLSPGTGKNILDSESVNFTDDRVNTTYNDGDPVNQNIVGLAVDDENFLYCLESQYGRVYIYDKECHMLTAFGGGLQNGTQSGTFQSARALALNGSDVLVCDGMNGTVTVFRRTAFGDRLLAAQTQTLDGDYTAAKENWQQLIRSDENCQPAYRGLARAYLAENDYETALSYARSGYDRETYALAFELKRQAFVNDHFALLFTGALLLAAGIIVLIVLGRRQKLPRVQNPELRLWGYSLVHPALAFERVKEQGQGSLVLCGITVAAYYVASVLQVLCGGFMFTYYDAESFNSLLVLLRSVGMVVLFVVCNWMVCTLMGGRGRLREIAVVASYSLLPLILEMLLRLVLTNVLLPDESAFLGILHTAALLYAAIMLIAGLVKVHDYSFSRLVGTGVLTVLGMAAVIFLLVMVCLLFQQLYGFLATVMMELML